MATGSYTKLDLYSIFDIYQNTALRYGKELIIATLQEIFSRDSYYHFQKDKYGYVKTPDHTNLPLGAGVHDDLTTRIFIGEKWPYAGQYYPALLVSAGGANYVPISFTRDKYAVQWKPIIFEDGYGNRKIYSTPDHFIRVGALEFSIEITIQTKDVTSRDELHDILMPIFYDIEFENLANSGLVILKPPSSSGPSEKGDRNDQIYQQVITLNCRGEFRRQIPISTVIDRINFCLDFANLEKNPPEIAENLRIQTDVDLLTFLENL